MKIGAGNLGEKLREEFPPTHVGSSSGVIPMEDPLWGSPHGGFPMGITPWGIPCGDQIEGLILGGNLDENQAETLMGNLGGSLVKTAADVNLQVRAWNRNR